MGQILSLAKSFGAETGNNPEVAQPPPTNDSDSPSFDPKLMQTALQLWQEYNRSDDRNLALLTALRPFLKEERAAKMDQAIQITKLSRVAKVAFQLFKGGETLV